jgi:hypothetical protein
MKLLRVMGAAFRERWHRVSSIRQGRYVDEA